MLIGFVVLLQASSSGAMHLEIGLPDLQRLWRRRDTFVGTTDTLGETCCVVAHVFQNTSAECVALLCKA